MDIKNHIDELQFKRLCQWSDQLCGFYAGQAYLVGSSILRPDFRDVDVVIVIQDDDFEMRYGNKYDLWNERVQKPLTDVSWKYYKDRIKRIRDGWAKTMLELDVKIQCETEFLGYCHMPKIRIDSSPFLPWLEGKIKLYCLPPVKEEAKTVDERPERITEEANAGI
jgi:hypothetical protein